MSSNWRRSIRNASKPPTATIVQTPALLTSLNQRAKKLKQRRFLETSQIEWINCYNKLMDEYHKVEAELNALDLHVDTQNNLHSQIKHHRKEYTKWMQNVIRIVSTLYLNEDSTFYAVQSVQNQLNQEREQLSNDQETLEKELKAMRKSIAAMECEEDETQSIEEGISMRKENVKYYEFCLQHELNATDSNGGWTPQHHQKFCSLFQQFKHVPFSRLREQCSLHFPHKTSHELKQHYDWYRLYLQHISTNKRMKCQMRTKHKLLTQKQKSNQLIERSLQRIALQEQSERELFESKLLDLRQQRDEIQVIRQEQQQQQAFLQQQQIEAEQMQEMEKTTQWNEYRNEQKGKLNEYYKEKISELERKEMEEEKQRKLEGLKQRELSRVNRKRVEYREHKQNEKMQMQKDLAMQRREEIKMKEERLSRLRESVKQRLDVEHIQDLSGICNETENVKNRTRQSQNVQGAVDMYPSYGYSDEQLFEDERFALLNQLVSRNLHNNQYAKQCLQKVDASTKARKDCQHKDIF